MPLSLDACEDCGAGFLSGATAATATHIPLVGDVGKLSQGQRLLVGVGVALVLMILFVIVFAIGGHFAG